MTTRVDILSTRPDFVQFQCHRVEIGVQRTSVPIFFCKKKDDNYADDFTSGTEKKTEIGKVGHQLISDSSELNFAVLLKTLAVLKRPVRQRHSKSGRVTQSKEAQ